MINFSGICTSLFLLLLEKMITSYFIQLNFPLGGRNIISSHLRRWQCHIFCKIWEKYYNPTLNIKPLLNQQIYGGYYNPYLHLNTFSWMKWVSHYGNGQIRKHIKFSFFLYRLLLSELLRRGWMFLYLLSIVLQRIYPFLDRWVSIKILE